CARGGYDYPLFDFW
nr:immunoglobulin heavy chain junction region [Mus musculus]